MHYEYFTEDNYIIQSIPGHSMTYLSILSITKNKTVIIYFVAFALILTNINYEQLELT